MTVELHKGDLPRGLFDGAASIAVDSETLGLNPLRDRLCVIQLSAGDGDAHLVQLDGNYAAPELKRLLANPNVLKIFHFARFDMAVMQHYLGTMPGPVYCTKIASRLARTFTDRHSLKDLCRDFLGIELSKQQQSSDWGVAELGEEQIAYAASDVLYLHEIKRQLDVMLAREQRQALAEGCFAFLPTRAELDLAGWYELDPFAH